MNHPSMKNNATVILAMANEGAPLSLPNENKPLSIDFDAEIKTKTPGLLIGFNDGSKDGSGVGDFDNEQYKLESMQSFQTSRIAMLKLSAAT